MRINVIKLDDIVSTRAKARGVLTLHGVATHGKDI